LEWRRLYGDRNLHSCGDLQPIRYREFLTASHDDGDVSWNWVGRGDQFTGRHQLWRYLLGDLHIRNGSELGGDAGLRLCLRRLERRMFRHGSMQPYIDC
jgi:hypothetical protein